MEGMEFSKEFIERLSKILFYQDIDDTIIAENHSQHEFPADSEHEFNQEKRISRP